MHPLRSPTDPAHAAAPPPPFEDTPERPLFADTERRVPAGAGRAAPRSPPAPAGWAPGPPRRADTGAGARHAGAVMTDTGGGTGTGGFWPFVDEDEEKNEVHTGTEGRGWLRTAIAVGVLLLIVVAMVVAFNRGRKDGATPDRRQHAVRGRRARHAAADPPDPGGQGLRPRGRPRRGEPAGRRQGDRRRPGHELDDADLPQQPRARRPEVRRRPPARPRRGPEGAVGDRPARRRPHQRRGVRRRGRCHRVARRPRPARQGRCPRRRARRRPACRSPAPTTRYLLVWLTKLPAADGGYRGEITDVTVRS